MKVIGKSGNRMVDYGGEKIKLHEKSYKAGKKAGRKLLDPLCIYAFDGCELSFAAGYCDALSAVTKHVEGMGFLSHASGRKLA